MKKIGHLFRKSYDTFENWRQYSNSRKEAHRLRKQLVDKKGSSFLDRKLLKQIKEYSNAEFGSPEYWPWLAFYTEIREDFIEGWIPDEYFRFELIPKLNPRPIAMVSTVKSFDHRLFEGFAVDPIAVKISGCFFDQNQQKIKKQDLLELLKSIDKEIVVKIDGGPSGKGHMFIPPDEMNSVVLEEISDCVIQPVVNQHSHLNELYDKSVNTLRIVTLLKNDGTVAHKYTFLRCGSGGSRVDNVRAGGYFLLIDLDGNVVSPAYDGSGNRTGRKHPDTGFEYNTLRVPSVSEAVQKCKESHLQFPYVKLIAWDVFINEQANFGLLEWNARSPTMWLVEAIKGPLYLNEGIH